MPTSGASREGNRRAFNESKGAGRMSMEGDGPIAPKRGGVGSGLPKRRFANPPLTREIGTKLTPYATWRNGGPE